MKKREEYIEAVRNYSLYSNKQRNILVRGISSKYPHLVDVEDLSTNFLRTYDIQQLKQENPTVQFNF